MNNRKLIFLTINYPFGRGEEFVKNELDILSKYFDKILIIPILANYKNTKRKLPQNCELIDESYIKILHRKFKKNNMYKRIFIFFHPKTMKYAFKELFFGIKYIKFFNIGKLFDDISFYLYNGYCVFSHLKDFLLNFILQSNLNFLNDSFQGKNIHKKIKKINTKNNEKNLQKIFEKESKNNPSLIFYSYWTNFTALSFIFFKRYLNKKGIFIPFITRMHGFDLYSFRKKINYQIFQKFLISNILDKTYVNCEFGKNHIVEYFKKEKIPENKISVHYLGIDLNINSNNKSSNYEYSEENRSKYFNSSQFNKNKIVQKLYNIYSKNEKPVDITLVSCAFFAKVKRIEKIAELFLKINTPVNWIHIGSGPENEINKIIKYIEQNISYKNKNIKKYYFTGYMENTEIFSFYRKIKPDLFINFSESEGVPVSIMEAMANKIPVLATSAGGIPEIVIDNFNGFLVPVENPVQPALDKINDYLFYPESKRNFLRENAEKIVMKKFNKNINYKEFAKNIIELLN